MRPKKQGYPKIRVLKQRLPNAMSKKIAGSFVRPKPTNLSAPPVWELARLQYCNEADVEVEAWRGS